MRQLSEITLAVLAGGAGTRMGNPKSRLVVQGKSMLQYLLERWDWPGPTMLVTAPGNEHPPGCELFVRELIDAVAGEGPLRGIFTALEASETDLVVVTTCDMPLVTREQLEATAMKLTHAGMMWRRERGIEPFPSAYNRRQALAAIAPRVAAGRLSVQALADLPAFTVVNAPMEWPESVWLNLNTPEDYQDFIRRSSSSDHTHP